MNFQEIDDSNLPCVASTIGSVLVPEALSVLECCQDADNLNIIYIRLSITGVFDYTPSISAEVDGVAVDITPLFIPSYKGIGEPSLLIKTNYGSRNILLAFNAGVAINNFASTPVINLTIRFNGTANFPNLSPFINSSNVLQSSNPTVTYSLNKGIVPTPYKIYFDRTTNQLKVQYIGIGTNACLCAINCVNPTDEDYSLTVCNDEVQEVTIDNNEIFGDPTSATITFRDSIGNISNIEIHSVLNVSPASPGLSLLSQPTGVQIMVWFISKNGVAIDNSKVSYQILRYENNTDNVKVLFDWTDKDWKVLVDRDIRSGRKYGYSVRFKGEFGEISELSSWSVISI